MEIEKHESGHGINKQAYPYLILMLIWLGFIWIVLPTIFTILNWFGKGA